VNAISVEDLSALPIAHQAEIPDSYLDDMGHMNVMWYTHLFSCATIEFLEHIGMDRAYFTENHSGAFALEAYVRYLAEIRVGKHVTVRTRLIGRSEKRFHFMHFLVIDEGPVLATTSEFISAHIDMNVRRMSPIPETITTAYDALLRKHEQLDWQPPLCGTMQP